MAELNITNAKYWKNPQTNEQTHILCNINGSTDESFVPIDLENSHYQDIKKQIDDGSLTIADAD